MRVSYEGIGYLAMTLPSNSAEEGQLCMVNAVGQVDKCDEGESFCGFVEIVRDGMAAMQIEGTVEVGYTGPTPLAGYTKLSSNGKGGVKADTSGREYLVLSMNAEKATITIKL